MTKMTDRSRRGVPGGKVVARVFGCNVSWWPGLSRWYGWGDAGRCATCAHLAASADLFPNACQPATLQSVVNVAWALGKMSAAREELEQQGVTRHDLPVVPEKVGSRIAYL